MKPLFHPALINGPFGDPGLYVDCLFEKRALLFDLGELRELAPRKILRVSDVFVSHAHMDHFIGFDRLLRVCLGREHMMRLYGPSGFLAQVTGRLGAYTWNLTGRYATDFTLEATEIHAGGMARRARFRCQAAFGRENEHELAVDDGILLDEPAFRVRCALLDHGTPCLGFALEEKQHVNVWKNRLEALGFPTGPWLRELKHAVLARRPDTTSFRVWWTAQGAVHEQLMPLGELKQRILEVVPGQKLAYITDVAYQPENAARIVALATGADLLFIEAPFLAADTERAAQKFHLTAHQAGCLARAAGVKAVIPFHFSPRYNGREAELRGEVAAAFANTGARR
jgi:ribonuclease Z